MPTTNKKLMLPKWVSKNNINEMLVQDTDIYIAVYPDPFGYPSEHSSPMNLKSGGGCEWIETVYKMLIINKREGQAVNAETRNREYRCKCDEGHSPNRSYYAELIQRNEGRSVAHIYWLPDRQQATIDDETNLTNGESNLSRILYVLKLANISNNPRVSKFANDVYDAAVAAYTQFFKEQSQHTTQFYEGKFREIF